MKYPWSALLVLFAATGCYRYTPIQLELVPVGDHVQLVTTRAGASDLVAMTTVESPLPELEGVLVGRDSQTVTLQVPIAGRRDGIYRPNLDATVKLDVNDVLRVSRRDLNRGATGLLIAGTAGFATLVITLIIDSYSSTDRPPSGGPIESILPVRGLVVPVTLFGGRR